MITKIKISAFKSLVDFEIELVKFNCIIGLNGAGKSTVLQVISYISAIMKGDVDTWLKDRGWDNSDVVSNHYPSRETLTIDADFKFNDKNYTWQAVYNWKKGFCISETIIDLSNTEQNLLRVYQGKLKTNKGEQDVYFKYSGSILSVLDDNIISFELKKIRDFIIQIANHDLLSPKVMRSGQYAKQGNLDSAGKYLISYVHHLDRNAKDIVKTRIAEYFPQVIKIETAPLESGGLRMFITERFYEDSGEHKDFKTDARHINDGMLRILNILVNQQLDSTFQLFDEIENGVNPEITEKLMDAFTRAPQQTLVTTHSPMVLNYLEDSVAEQSVIFVYKRKDGKTRAKKLFEIPSAKIKLEDLAPGEAMVDLYLENVAFEAEKIELEELSN